MIPNNSTLPNIYVRHKQTRAAKRMKNCPHFEVKKDKGDKVLINDDEAK